MQSHPVLASSITQPEYREANFSQAYLTIPWLFMSSCDAAFAALLSGVLEAVHHGNGNAEYTQLPDVLTTF